MRRFRKLLSLMLVLALSVSMLSGTVLALDDVQNKDENIAQEETEEADTAQEETGEGDTAQDETGEGDAAQDAEEYSVSVDAEESVTYYDSIGEAFTYANGLDTACTIRLWADCETDTALEVKSSAEITLDLAGHSLGISDGARIRVLKVFGRLTLTDSGSGSEKGMIYGGSATYGGSVYVDAGAVFFMSGGSISGGNATNGGNIYICADGEFVMSGGSIGKGSATNGGGVYVKGSLTMAGGEISSNTAKTSGGGVYLDKESTFTLSDGSITGNTADYGAGVYNGRAEFTMTGGSITGNTADVSGGGVRIYGWDSALGKFTMSGGEITGNTAGTSGGGVYVSDGYVFELYGEPVITGNTVNGGANNLYLASGKTVTLAGEFKEGASIGITTQTAPSGDVAVPVTSAEKSTAYYKTSLKYFSSDKGYTTRLNGNGYIEVCVDNLYEDCVAKVTGGSLNEKYYDSLKDAFTYANGQRTACTIILLMDCEADGILSVSGRNITLDLSGYTVTLNDRYISVVNEGTFTLTDSSETGTGTIIGGRNRCVSVSDSDFIMEGGTIQDCSVTGNGGAVSMGGDPEEGRAGTFTMKGGTIRDCSATGSGGAVFFSYGIFSMSGGSIIDCSASNGGAVGYSVYSIPINLKGVGTFVMTGGSIRECTADSYGGGVYVPGVSNSSVPGTFEMTGGEITSCSAGSAGGGVYVMGGDTIIRTGGSAFISGSTVNGESDNLYLSKGKTFAVSEAFTSGQILVTTAVAVTSVTPVSITGKISNPDLALFHVMPDNDRYGVRSRNSCLELYMEEYEAKVENSKGDITYFFSLERAFSYINAQPYPCKVTLMTDCQISGVLSVKKGQDITLDLSGRMLAAKDGTSCRMLLVNGTLNITDSTWSGKGTITGGYAENGGAVYVLEGSLTMSGGIISGNTAEGSGGAVYISGGTFVMTGGTITGNKAGDCGGGVVFDRKSTVCLSGSAVIASNEGGNVVDNIYLQTGQTITLAGSLTEDARIGVYTEEKADNLDGVQVTTTEAGTSYYSSAVSCITSDRRYGVRANSNGYVEFYSTWFAQVEDSYGNVTYYETVEEAFDYANALSGVCTVTLLGDYEIFASLDTHSGRTIILDLAGYTLRAAVTMTNVSILKVHGNLTLTDSGGTGVITGCSKNGKGAGVYVYNNGTFTMRSGTISGNTAGYNGGGVYVSGGTFIMTGGEITGNTADAAGGGVYLAYGSVFRISGTPVIKGNKSNYLANNVYLRSGQQIILSGKLMWGADVGVTTGVTPIESKSVQVTATEEDTDYYQSAAIYLSSDRGWYIRANVGGYAELYRKVTGAQDPSILIQPENGSYMIGENADALTVEAAVTDGGTLSYQWYRSSTAKNSGGQKIAGATEVSYTPPTDEAGIWYYYCIVTNTNNNVTRKKTASTTSAIAAVTVNGGNGGGAESGDGDTPGDGSGGGANQGDGNETNGGSDHASGRGNGGTAGFSESILSEAILVQQNTAETAETILRSVDGDTDDSIATKTVIASAKSQEAAAESRSAEKTAASIETGETTTASEVSGGGSVSEGGSSRKGGSAQKAKIYEILEKVEEAVKDETNRGHMWLLLGLLCILAGITVEGSYFKYQRKYRRRKKSWRRRVSVFR